MKSKNIIFILLIISLVMLVYYLVISNQFGDWAERGQFGDSFGAIATFFSGLAFAGLIYTIYLQRIELKLQRQELKLQREEMVKSRVQLSEQVKILKAQYTADIAKIKVSAIELEIEAIKMEALRTSAKEKYVKQIRDSKTKLQNLAFDLENILKE